MKTQRLDWMKFFVADFMSSEDVMMMSGEEVGQFCLLLFTAWLGGKDCTLPNDPKFLERTARGPVSSLVLSKFKEVDGRLVNEVQQALWKEGQELYGVLSERGKKARAKQLSDKESASCQQDAGPLPAEMNRCEMNTDEMKKEHRSNVAAATGPSNGSVAPDSFSATTPGNSSAPPATATSKPLPTLFKNPDYLDDDDWRILSDDAKLANIFYDLLPEENQKAAPQQWERLWSEDLTVLTDGWELVRDVLLHASRKKDKQGVRIYVRMSSVIENYERLKAETLKLKKKIGAAKAASPVARPPSNGKPPTPLVAHELMTKSEESQSHQAQVARFNQETAARIAQREMELEEL